MGDRGNVFIVQDSDYNRINTFDKQGIYLYTHWSGSEWPALLAHALKVGKPRWGDDSYLTRIIIDQMFKNIRDDETGGGVSLQITDNEHLITICDMSNFVVAFAHPGGEHFPNQWFAHHSFATFISLEDPDYPETDRN
jgi:hypothetical protein